MLINAPLGISWSTIPSFNATSEEQLAEQTNICNRASATADARCNQTLRAANNTEDIEGPDYRLTIRQTQVARVFPSEWPVLEITQIQYGLAGGFPLSLTTLASTQYRVSQRLTGPSGVGPSVGQGVGPSEILIAPGIVSWDAGRYGYLVRVSYVAGWPHAGLTAAATASATTVSVDECAGFAAGGLSTVATIYDGASTETVTVTAASASSGPGTLTLSAGLQYAHAAGVLCSTLPGNVQWAVMLYAAAEALERGATATTVPAMPGSESSGGGPSSQTFRVEADRLLAPFARVI